MSRPTVRRMDAYRVPFRVDRDDRGLRLTNRGPSPLHWVRLIAHGDGVAVARPIPRLPPGGTIAVRLHGERLARDTLLVVQWVREDGATYLTSIAL